jgi:hypothetical protein
MNWFPGSAHVTIRHHPVSGFETTSPGAFQTAAVEGVPRVPPPLASGT